MIEQFHFIRPLWLLALLPLLAISWLLFKQRFLSRSWQSVIDPALLPHLLNDVQQKKRGRSGALLFFIAGLAGILSLAGPTWEKLPQPVFKQQSALVIALDLSRSMDATDIKPSRLSRARHKISDLLKLRKEGQTALIAYAAQAFTVTPLTDDTQTIASLLPSLSTDIMPAQGSRSDQAIAKALQLLANGGIRQGHILLVTDGADAHAEAAIEQAVAQGHKVSILALGTAAGAPIPLPGGGFLKDAAGSIVIPKLDLPALKALAQAGHGRISLLSADDRDIRYLNQLFTASRLEGKASPSELKTDQWKEQGHWLLLIVIPLAALAFRRGILAALLVFFMLPLPQPAHALSWDELWLNDNQRAAKALQNKQPEKAAKLFDDPAWKGSAAYRAGQYEQALKNFSQLKTADGFYNRGNALARSGRLDEAIKAYEKALQLNPQHEDAKYNKELLEKQKQQQKNQQAQNKNKNQQQNSKQNQQSANGNRKQQGQQGQQQNRQQSQQSQKPSADNKKDASSQSRGEQSDQQKSGRNQQTQSGKDAKDKPQKKDASRQQGQKPENKKDTPDSARQKARGASDEQPQSLSDQAAQQWLRRIPDDPGGLLRNKFKYQYKRQGYDARETQDW